MENAAALVGKLKSDFGRLWSFQMHGETAEIITPFPTVNGSFVSVFIKQQEDGFAVTDGGLLDSGSYLEEMDINDPVTARIISRFSENHSVQRHSTKPVFFRKAKELKQLSSAVFDIASFVSAVVNARVANALEPAKADDRFARKANNFLAESIGRFKDLQFSTNFPIKSHSITFSAAIIRGTTFTAIQYITGSSPSYFRNSACVANYYFEITNTPATPTAERPASVVALVDDHAKGYQDVATRRMVESEILPLHCNRIVSWSVGQERPERLIPAA